MSDIERLLAIMARLRDPERGCPWDAVQTFESIAPYTIEEAYEVAHAIERRDRVALRDELGDLLLQVVYHARMAEEEGAFAFEDVVSQLCDKLVRRHDHVFGEGGSGEQGANVAPMPSESERRAQWEALKAAERGGRDVGEGDAFERLLADVPRAQPALMRARKLLSRARSALDSDLEDAAGAQARVHVAAFLDEAGEKNDSDRLGTLLLSCVREAAARNLDAEDALRGANARLEERVREHMSTRREPPT